MQLYAFGSNGSGQLGIGSTDDVSTPQLCLFPDDAELPGRPLKIVAGGNHTVLLLDNGTVYYAGSPRDGQVNSGSPLPLTSTFRKAYISRLGDKVVNGSAFWEGSVFVNAENEVFTAGLGSKGERGIGGISASLGLQMLENFPPNQSQDWSQIVDVASGVDHTVAVLADGDVWGWGNGRKGQLAQPEEFVWVPRRFCDLEFPVIRAVCGREFTLLIGHGGRCTILGSNKHAIKSQTPSAIHGWADISASWGSLFVLKSSGRIESWGRNDHGQLTPPGLTEIEQIAAGSEHVVALTKDNKVISWGWGEHGNCGSNTDADGDVKGNWNEIYTGQAECHPKVLGIGAGCATSFFWTESSDIEMT